MFQEHPFSDGEFENLREQETLPLNLSPPERTAHLFEGDALMRRVLVDQDHAAR